LDDLVGVTAALTSLQLVPATFELKQALLP